MRSKDIKNLVQAGLCLALCLLLPFLTGQIPQIGSMLSPMHLPVFLCGILCGWPYGLIVGFIAPLLRFFIFSMPAMPSALSMAFEMAVYGVVVGILYRVFPKKTGYIYLSLIIAMLCGKAVWGISQLVILSQTQNPFSWNIFMAKAFINAWPGILSQLIIIPILILSLKKAKVFNDE